AEPGGSRQTGAGARYDPRRRACLRRVLRGVGPLRGDGARRARRGGGHAARPGSSGKVRRLPRGAPGAPQRSAHRARMDSGQTHLGQATPVFPGGPRPRL
ncbi:MAG: hypothetical protein AVDCRST_MAG28-2292, partial [uncultured Rubrobacteraceae bacterium]